MVCSFEGMLEKENALVGGSVAAPRENVMPKRQSQANGPGFPGAVAQTSAINALLDDDDLFSTMMAVPPAVAVVAAVPAAVAAHDHFLDVAAVAMADCHPHIRLRELHAWRSRGIRGGEDWRREAKSGSRSQCESKLSHLVFFLEGLGDMPLAANKAELSCTLHELTICNADELLFSDGGRIVFVR